MLGRRTGRPRRAGLVPARHRHGTGRARRGRERGPGPAARRPGPPAADHRLGHRRRRVDDHLRDQGAVHRRGPRRPRRRHHASCPASPWRSSPGSSRCPWPSVGGIGLGIAEWTIRWNVRAESVFDVAFLVAILVALLLRRERTQPRRDRREQLGRRRRAQAASPRELRARARGAAPVLRVLGAVGAARVLVYPLTLAPSTMVTLTFGVLWCMVGVSLAVLTGWGGNISLGQFAIVGVGAMATGNALIRWNLDVFASLAPAPSSPARSPRSSIGRAGPSDPRPVPGGDHARVRRRPRLVLPQPGQLPRARARPDHPSGAVEAIRPGRASGSPTTCASPCSAPRWLVVRADAPPPGRSGDDRRPGQRAGRRRPGRPRRPGSSCRPSCSPAASPAWPAASTSSSPAAPARARSTQPCRSRCSRFAVIGGLGSVAGRHLGRGPVPPARLRPRPGRRRRPAAEILRLSLTGGGLLLILYFLPGGLWQYVQRRPRPLPALAVADRRGILVPSLVADRRVDDADDRPEDETSVISGALS